MAKGYFKAAFEDQPGNETNATVLSAKTLYVPAISVQPSLGANPMERDDEIRNLDEPVPVIPEAYAPSYDLETRVYPDVTAFFLTAMLCQPVSTAGNGVITDPDSVVIPSGVTRHVWTAPFGPSGIAPQTFEGVFAYKDQGVFFKQRGCGTEKFGIDTPESGGARLKCGGPALYMQRTSDPSLSPAYESLAIRPFTRGDLTVDWLTGGGRIEDFSFDLANPIDTVRSLGVKSKYPDAMEKGEGLIVCTGSVPKRILDQDDYDALLNSTGFAAKARWVNDTLITGSYPYKLFLEMSNAQLVSGEVDPLTNKRRHGSSYSFRSSRNASASVTITICNATASYA